MPKILFILKRNDAYGQEGRSSGLLNSARGCCEALGAMGMECCVVQVHDNNDIDREVTRGRPNIVVIEALWVVPEKFDVLDRLHPTVKWVVRIHSKLAFLSGEGIACEWIRRYARHPAVQVACNDEATQRDVSRWTGVQAAYLPTCYVPVWRRSEWRRFSRNYVDVACCGAIRPLKNQLVQAWAAIEFGHRIGKRVRFHVNASRLEMRGEPILKNLRGSFSPPNELVQHGWMESPDWHDFLRYVDVGMQVSLSETFNIVGADTVSDGVPLVASCEVPWCSWIGRAEPDSVESCVKALLRAWEWPRLNVSLQRAGLRSYCAAALAAWKVFLA